jgi:hypothetical protein
MSIRTLHMSIIGSGRSRLRMSLSRASAGRTSENAGRWLGRRGSGGRRWSLIELPGSRSRVDDAGQVLEQLLGQNKEVSAAGTHDVVGRLDLHLTHGGPDIDILTISGHADIAGGDGVLHPQGKLEIGAGVVRQLIELIRHRVITR